jgi:CRISPR/Cas system CSM-associated protein Csm2 small subunit
VFVFLFKLYYESYFYIPNIEVYQRLKEVTSTLLDELVLNHQLKWYFNHFDKFYQKVLNFHRFFMHEYNAHIRILLIYNL